MNFRLGLGSMILLRNEQAYDFAGIQGRQLHSETWGEILRTASTIFCPRVLSRPRGSGEGELWRLFDCPSRASSRIPSVSAQSKSLSDAVLTMLPAHPILAWHYNRRFRGRSMSARFLAFDVAVDRRGPHRFFFWQAKTRKLRSFHTTKNVSQPCQL